jgi:hypothetical protein
MRGAIISLFDPGKLLIEFGLKVNRLPPAPMGMPTPVNAIFVELSICLMLGYCKFGFIGDGGLLIVSWGGEKFISAGD